MQRNGLLFLISDLRGEEENEYAEKEKYGLELPNELCDIDC